MENTLVNEVPAVNPSFETVKNWWIVCLFNGRLNGHDWNTPVSKRDLYDLYKKESLNSVGQETVT